MGGEEINETGLTAPRGAKPTMEFPNDQKGTKESTTTNGKSTKESAGGSGGAEGVARQPSKGSISSGTAQAEEGSDQATAKVSDMSQATAAGEAENESEGAARPPRQSKGSTKSTGANSVVESEGVSEAGGSNENAKVEEPKKTIEDDLDDLDLELSDSIPDSASEYDSDASGAELSDDELDAWKNDEITTELLWDDSWLEADTWRKGKAGRWQKKKKSRASKDGGEERITLTSIAVRNLMPYRSATEFLVQKAQNDPKALELATKLDMLNIFQEYSLATEADFCLFIEKMVFLGLDTEENMSLLFGPDIGLFEVKGLWELERLQQMSFFHVHGRSLYEDEHVRKSKSALRPPSKEESERLAVLLHNDEGHKNAQAMQELVGLTLRDMRFHLKLQKDAEDDEANTKRSKMFLRGKIRERKWKDDERELEGKKKPFPAALRMKCTLESVSGSHECMREVVVPADMSFKHLSILMTIMFGWTGEKMHYFEDIKNVKFGDESVQDVFNCVPYKKAILDDLFHHRDCPAMFYVYDLTNRWRHKIEMVEVFHPKSTFQPWLTESSGGSGVEGISPEEYTTMVKVLQKGDTTSGDWVHARNTFSEAVNVRGKLWLGGAYDWQDGMKERLEKLVEILSETGFHVKNTLRLYKQRLMKEAAEADGEAKTKATSPVSKSASQKKLPTPRGTTAKAETKEKKLPTPRLTPRSQEQAK